MQQKIANHNLINNPANLMKQQTLLMTSQGMVDSSNLSGFLAGGKNSL